MKIFKKFLFMVGLIFTSIFGALALNSCSQPVQSYTTIKYANSTVEQKIKFSADNETQERKFTIGISSSYSFHVIKVDPDFDKEPKVTMEATSANIKIRQDGTTNAYTVLYDSNSSDKPVEVEVKLSYLDDNNQDIPQDSFKFLLVEQSKTLWDWVMGILSSAVGTTLSLTALFTILWRSALKVYDKGKNDKKELVTKQELKDFEADTRKDMRGYVRQITETVTDSSLRIIEKELKPLDDVVAMSNDMKIMKQKIDNDLQNMNDKYDEIKQIGDTVRSLSTKVTRIEYGQDASTERRTER